MPEENVEQAAREQGWRPLDEYNGDPDRWKTAEQFVEDGKKIAPIQAERNEKLLQETRALRAEMEQLKRSNMQTIKEAKEIAYKQAIADLKEKQIKTVEEADTEGFQKIQQKIDSMEEEQKKATAFEEPPAKQQNQPPEEYVEFSARNQWYTKDPELTDYADYVGPKIAASFADTPEGRRDFFNAVEARVKKAFPDKFESKQTSKAVESPSGSPSSGKKVTYNDLPPEFKAACDRQVKQGIFKNKEEYVKVYAEEFK